MEKKRKGPKSHAPGGYGHLSQKGYRRVWDITQQRYRMEHVMVWEKANGLIPEGYQIHHKDENKLNNSIENLEILTALEHKRKHSGAELREGVWFLNCTTCKQKQPENEFYKIRGWPHTECKKCMIRRAVRNKNIRKNAAKGKEKPNSAIKGRNRDKSN